MMMKFSIFQSTGNPFDPFNMCQLSSHASYLLLSVFSFRISYCSADANYDRVVAFIATNVNETHECHAFLTRKDEVARACGNLIVNFSLLLPPSFSCLIIFLISLELLPSYQLIIF